MQDNPTQLRPLDGGLAERVFAIVDQLAAEFENVLGDAGIASVLVSPAATLKTGLQ